MMALEAELQRRVPSRRVRVFQRPSPPYNGNNDRISSSISGDGRVGGREGPADRRELFDGLVEVECGGSGAWLGVRIALWRAAGGPSEQHFRTVQCVLWHEESGGRRLAARVAERVEGEAEVEIEDGGGNQGSYGIAMLLATVVRDVVARFRAANVQELSAMDAPRAKFEFELLQHHRELDVVVLRQGEVLFALPLFAADGHLAVQEETRGGLEGGAFLPRVFARPLVEHGQNRTIVSLRLANTDDGDSIAWDVSLAWSRELRLSSQVTQLSRAAGDAESSVDIITSCKQAFVSQWTKRRDFVGELHAKALVLEFDPVDFSRVFFVLQEQLDPRAPLRVLVLALAFTPEFFLTRSLTDLRVHLLDGRDNSEGVAISLASHATDTIDAWEHDTPVLVVAFLQSLQSALIQHLYES